MKPTRSRYKRHIERLCMYFRSAVFAGEYQLKIRHVDKLDNEYAYGQIHIDLKYLMLTVTFSDHLWEEYRAGRYRAVAVTVCHEFCHVLTEALYDIAYQGTAPNQRHYLEEIRERQTERVSSSILDLVPASVWKEKK